MTRHGIACKDRRRYIYKANLDVGRCRQVDLKLAYVRWVIFERVYLKAYERRFGFCKVVVIVSKSA